VVVGLVSAPALGAAVGRAGHGAYAAGTPPRPPRPGLRRAVPGRRLVLLRQPAVLGGDRALPGWLEIMRRTWRSGRTATSTGTCCAEGAVDIMVEPEPVALGPGGLPIVTEAAVPLPTCPVSPVRPVAARSRRTGTHEDVLLDSHTLGDFDRSDRGRAGLSFAGGVFGLAVPRGHDRSYTVANPCSLIIISYAAARTAGTPPPHARAAAPAGSHRTYLAGVVCQFLGFLLASSRADLPLSRPVGGPPPGSASPPSSAS